VTRIREECKTPSAVLEYGTPPPPKSPAVTGWLAVGCTALAWFWLGILWSEAWALSAAFGLGGCAAATVGLRSPHLQAADRFVFAACLVASAFATCVTVLG
jgi:hypothetical protein